MKFWRHLVVVAVLVAAVVVLGVLWERSSEADWITPPGPPVAGGPPPGMAVKLPPGAHLPAGTHVPAGARVVNVAGDGERGMWLDLSDVGNLTHTAEVVAAVMAWVIVADVARRRWRKARRAAAGSGGSARSPET
jgi:hypothetical protein